MSSRVERRGRSVLKQVTNGAAGERVARWSHHLSGCGVSTPTATYDSQTETLRFPWIYGTPGGDLLARALAADASTRGHVQTPETLRRLLGPLVRLHQIAPEGLALQQLDPWRRVRPRLAAFASAPPTTASFALAERAHALVIDLEAVGPSPEIGATLHGDLHVGQLLIDGDGRAWLLDLDDLALGPVEADLGNFVAHLCTKEPFAGPSILDDIRHYVRLVVITYVDAGGTEPDQRHLHWYVAAALVRRSLKLLEGGMDHGRIQLALSAAKHCLHVSSAL